MLVREIDRTIEQARNSDLPKEVQELGVALSDALARAAETTKLVLAQLARGGVDLALANSLVYLEMLGHVVVAWIWLWQALVAAAKMPPQVAGEAAFYRGKVQPARYFFRWEFPKTHAQCKLLADLDTTCLDMQDALF